MKLFIDDERNPVTNDWIIARSSFDASRIVTIHGIPEEIAFDHDLGGADTTKKFLFWLNEFMLDHNEKFPKDFKFSVHSQNPVGAKFINDYMTSLINYHGVEE